MEEKWTVFSLNLGVLPQKPETMSFPSREAALKHACSLPPRVNIFSTSKTLKASGYKPRKSRNCAVSIHCYGNIALNNNSAGLSGTKSRDLLPNWKEPNTPMRNWWAELIITWQTLSDAATANEAETPHRPTDDARQQFKTYKRIAPRSS